ncbi:hypothetical protein [Stutzerimonas azotifigens]|uniref:hypothetical protein n=1 Tax=Stutzerimonas azotifigens TaxID=291995 RepID=UPI00040358C8|nr:hypothetical protein [Stutzerimonas azotifigens]
MRLTYLLPPLAALLLIGCGPDEPDEPQTPPPAQSEMNAPAPGTDAGPTGTASPGAPRIGSGDAGTTGTEGGSAPSAPADNGSGLGTSSGSGPGTGSEGAASGNDTPSATPKP